MLTFVKRVFWSLFPLSLKVSSLDLNHIKYFDGSLYFEQIFQVDNIKLNNPVV